MDNYGLGKQQSLDNNPIAIQQTNFTENQDGTGNFSF